MSVPKSRRKQANTEYVRQASYLSSKVGAMCSRLPKRWAFTRTQYILEAANGCFSEAMKANAIYATNKTEADKRMEHLLEALGWVVCVEGYVDQLAEDNPRRPCDAGQDYDEQRPCITDGMFAEVGRTCESVEKLLKAVIKKDRAKWSTVRPKRRTSSRRGM